jgi:N utilization substance protein B
MLSRNNIRIKVMQTLYAHAVNPCESVVAEKNLIKSIHNSYRLYLLTVLYLQKVAFFNKKDYEVKINKFVPSEEDKRATLKLYDNPIAVALRENEVFQKTLKKEGIPQLVDDDIVRMLYKQYVETDYYESYRSVENPPIREHQYAFVKLYHIMRENEVFTESMEDHFISWEDDESLVYGAIKRSLRELPANNHFFIDQLPNKEFVDDLGKDLLYKVVRYDTELQQMIATKLKNWQEDRVALMDMTLMKMGICEFLYFPSIPTKVTINEYVNVAKEYSTDKSKRFINGILDRLMQELTEEGLIKKKGRGLLDE